MKSYSLVASALVLSPRTPAVAPDSHQPRLSRWLFSSRASRAGITAAIVIGALGVMASSGRAQTTVLSDTFGDGSTINSTVPLPANPALRAAAYQQIATKAYSPAPPAVEAGHLKFGIAGTTSGINQVQALFARYPVTLVNVGDYIELTVVFTNHAALFQATGNNALFIGLYNGNQQQPYRGGQANSTVALSGGVEGWAGYVGRVYSSGSSNNSNALLYRAAQTSATASNQDLVYASALVAIAGTTSNSSLATALTAGAQYTAVFRITKESDSSLKLAQSLYSGTDTSGTPFFTQETETATIATAVFDGLAVGYRQGVSAISTMDLNSIKVVTTGTVLVVPAITTPPLSQTKSVGDEVTLSVVADGGAGTELTYQWQKDAVDIAGATNPSYVIAAATLADAGDYTVVVTDAAGSTTSPVAILTVSSGAVAPQILTEPTGATLLVGGAKTFSALASGTATLSYQWQKSADGVAPYTGIEGATTNTLAIESVTLADAGYYQLVVTNGVGSATTTPVVLVVNQLPIITAEPVGANLNVGAPLTLSVTATGMPAPSYQWRRNGAAIPDATASTYSVASVTGADTGGYSVVVTNSVGAATSTTVSVAVLSPSMAITAVTPANNAGSILPDTPLTITFNSAPTIGAGGSIRIYDSDTDAVVDSIDLVAAQALKATLRTANSLSTLDLPVASKTVGGVANWNYYPLTVADNTVTFYPRNGVLARGKSYYVQIDPGVVVDSIGLSFAGINDKTTWAFATTSATPASATALTVAADGTGDFYTVQAAIDYVAPDNTTPTTISIKNGLYYELVYFTAKHNLTIVGESASQTRIVFPSNNSFNSSGPAYHRGTFYAHNVHDVVIANLTIMNSTPQGGTQAEALIVTGGAATGRNIISQVKLYSFQDTLQVNGQCYITDSMIEGDVDFLWGNGPSFFNNCDIRMRLRSGTPGYFSQIRNPATNHGYVFVNCRFTAEAGQTGTWLGRIDPNAAQFPYSEVVLIDAVMGDANNNSFLATNVGASGSNFQAGWWLLNNVTSDVSATTAANVRYWDFNTRDYLGAPVPFNTTGTRPAFTIMPEDAALVEKYRSASWVLNTTVAGVVNGDWVPAVAPILLSQSGSVSVLAGEPAVFTVEALAVPAATYQWFKDGAAITGATAATYSIPATAQADGGSYRVDVTNTAGMVSSTAANLTVWVTPTIATQPDLSQPAVTAGTAVTLSVVATGEGLTYQWKKDGVDVVGATGATLTLSNPRPADSGNYSVVITNPAGSVTSDAQPLLVVSPGGMVWQSYDQAGTRISADAASFDPETNTYTFVIPENTTQTLVTSNFEPLVLSKPATGNNNLPVTFTMIASGGYGLNGSVQSAYTGFGLFNDGGTAPGSSGNFTDDKGLWIELYQSTNAVSMKPQSVTSSVPNCPVSLFQSNINTPYGMGTGTGGALGTINDDMLVDLTVRPSALASGNVQLGTSASAAGTSGGVLVDHATNGTVLNRRVYSSASSGLSVKTDSIIFNEFGYHFQNSTGNPVTLRLSNFIGLVAAPHFTVQPPAVYAVTVGDSLTLTASAAGLPSTYRWQFSADGATFGDIDTQVNTTAATAALTLANAQMADAGAYRLVISNSGGSATSVPSMVTVSSTPFAPAIVVQPGSKTVISGSATTLRVVASGTAPLTYQWKRDGAAIADATSAVLTFTSTVLADAGAYTVVVTNAQGVATSEPATLAINYAPVISTQPVGATVAAGAAVTLSVEAAALPAATYQWKRNGVAVAGATSSTLAIASLAASDAGNYTVVVTNSAGAVTSAIAPVNVLSTALSIASLTPAASATGAFPDAPLTITFNQPVTAGIAGQIRIYDASNPAMPVDTIDFTSGNVRAASAAVLALPVQSQTIGTQAGFNYYPVLISGSTATIYPRNQSLTYGKTYYITVDAATFIDESGAAFAGFGDSAIWQFSTRAAPATATTYTVAADGSGDFASVQGAIDFVPAGNTTPTTILIKDGTYTGIVYWTAKHNLTIRGESRAGTIVGYRNNNTLNPSGTNWRAAFEGRNSTGTFLTNLTVKNFTPIGGSQAEAVYFNNSDTAQTIIAEVNLSSYQDTLNVNGPTYIIDTYIEGDTDFMWGNGPVFFERCELRMRSSATYFTQVRNPATNHGFVYHNCLFSADDNVTGVFLGRLNQNTPAYSEVVLINCREDDDMLNPLAWNLNGNTADQALANTLCVEYNCTTQTAGTPVDLTGRVAWAKTWEATANATEIANYSNPYWVLNTQKDGTAKSTPTTWTPAVAPMIFSQPASVAVDPGQSVAFTVSATALPTALTYQWQKDGVAIASATAPTLTLTDVQLTDAGNYSVVVTNSAGETTSEVATLTINLQSFTGTYFGQFAAGGEWALHVRSDNTGTFIAYLPQRSSALVLHLTVNADGRFAITGSEIQPLAASLRRTALSISPNRAARDLATGDVTLSGRITAAGVTGQIDELELTFSGTLDTATETPAATAGFYTGTALGTAEGTTYMVVGPSGLALVVTQTPALVVGGSGTVNADGSLAISTTEAQFAVTVNPQTMSFAATVTPAGGAASIVFAGLPDTVTSTTRIVNMSVRGAVGEHDSTLILGFVVAGAGSQDVLVRGVGPGLIPQGVPDGSATVDPQLRLFTHATGQQFAANDNWDGSSELRDTFAQLGAFALPNDSKDAAVATTLTPGAYSAHLTTGAPVSGISLIEVYDGSLAGEARFVNVSVRAEAKTDEGIVIAGFVLAGNAPKTLLIRGVGPSLVGQGVGASAVLLDPKLTLYRGASPIAENDNWGGSTALQTIFDAVGAFAFDPEATTESALVVTLEPGIYTVHLSGVNNTTGVALVEIYEVP